MENTVLVPQADIDRVEESRKELFASIPEEYHPHLVMRVTPALWHLTHRRYRQTVAGRIRAFLGF